MICKLLIFGEPLMNEKIQENTRSHKDKLKLWVSICKENWISVILNVLIYLMPIFLTIPATSKFFVKSPFKTILFIIVIIFINELSKMRIYTRKHLEVNKVKEKNKELEKENSDLESYAESIGLFLESLPKEFLRSVSKFLKLKNSERISLYVLDDDKFCIIGRYSENPTYDMKGRCVYPSDSGYISKCLKNDDGYPYYFREKLPIKYKSYVNAVSKDTGMTETEIANLSMKSRAYFTRVITDNNRNNVGILVIESTNSTLPMNANDLNNRLEELSIEHMATFLDVSNKLKAGSDYE